MITILIAKDENKIKDTLTRILKQEGYQVSANLNGPEDNIIRIETKNPTRIGDSLKDKVIELEDSLYKEKRGVLYKAILDEIEKPLIEYVLERTEGNQLKAAKVLGINRNTIRTKIKRLNIDVGRWKV